MNAYCVFLRPNSLVSSAHLLRNKRCYLSADTADRAILTVSGDNPEWRAIGVEPSALFAALPKASQPDPAPGSRSAA